MGTEKYEGWPRLKWRWWHGAKAVRMGGRECGVKGGGSDRIWGLVWGSERGGRNGS